LVQRNARGRRRFRSDRRRCATATTHALVVARFGRARVAADRAAHESLP
jgi:hypothetical protein